MAIGQPYNYEIDLNERFDGAEEKTEDSYQMEDGDGTDDGDGDSDG